jgi:ATP-binding cassette, subfamily C (CFTR/MRP), member 1
MPLKLEAPVAENGNNFSLGTKQLFCLSRCILKETSILVLDEATRSVCGTKSLGGH